MNKEVRLMILVPQEVTVKQVQEAVTEGLRLVDIAVKYQSAR